MIEAPIFPINRVSIVLQTRASNWQINNDDPIYWNSTKSIANQVYREQSISGYWRGYPIHIAYSMMIPALSVLGYLLFKGKKRDLRVIILMNLFNAASYACKYPLEVLQVRYQTDFRYRYKGVLDCAMKVYKERGISTFFTGIALSGFRVFAQSMTFFSLLTSVKKEHRGGMKGFLIRNGIVVLCGLIFYPLTTITRRMIVSNSKPGGRQEGVIATTKKIFKEERMKGFFVGAELMALSLVIGSVSTIGVTYLFRAMRK